MTTRLDILNDMLAVNGESPVSSTSSTNPAAIQANNKLDRVSKRIQARGWWFNKEVFKLSPSLSTGRIVLPSNTLSIDPVNTGTQYVQRGNNLYDLENNTFEIDEAVEVAIVLQLDISDLPQTASDYIAAKAIKEHYTADDGDPQKIAELKNDEAEGYAYMLREHLSNSDVNIRNSYTGKRLLRHTSVGTTAYIDTGA